MLNHILWKVDAFVFKLHVLPLSLNIIYEFVIFAIALESYALIYCHSFHIFSICTIFRWSVFYINPNSLQCSNNIVNITQAHTHIQTHLCYIQHAYTFAIQVYGIVAQVCPNSNFLNIFIHSYTASHMLVASAILASDIFNSPLPRLPLLHLHRRTKPSLFLYRSFLTLAFIHLAPVCQLPPPKCVWLVFFRLSVAPPPHHHHRSHLPLSSSDLSVFSLKNPYKQKRQCSQS